MLTHKIIYNYPFVMVMPVQWIETKMHAPIVTIEKDHTPLVEALINHFGVYPAGHVFTTSR